MTHPSHPETVSSIPRRRSPSICPENHNNNHSNDSQKRALRLHTKRKLSIAITLCFIFFTIELAAGFIAGSLAIISDAFHLLTDIAGFAISLVAIYLSEKPATHRHSFGYHRAEVLGAILSTLLIWLLTAVLLWEAFARIWNPTPIDGKIMFWTALVGVFINVVLAWTLHDHHHHHDHNHDHTSHEHSHEHEHTHEDQLPLLHETTIEVHDSQHSIDLKHDHHHHHQDISISAATLHVIGDLVSSIGVLISSIIIWIDPTKTIFDPLCTFFFSAIVLYTTFSLLKHSIHVLMEKTPTHINPLDVLADLAKIPLVQGVHDLHIWNISVNKPAIAVHLDLVNTLPNTTTPLTVIDYNQTLLQAQHLVCLKYHIHHATIQIENASFSNHSEEWDPDDEDSEVNLKGVRLHCDPDFCRV